MSFLPYSHSCLLVICTYIISRFSYVRINYIIIVRPHKRLFEPSSSIVVDQQILLATGPLRFEL